MGSSGLNWDIRFPPDSDQVCREAAASSPSQLKFRRLQLRSPHPFNLVSWNPYLMCGEKVSLPFPPGSARLTEPDNFILIPSTVLYSSVGSKPSIDQVNGLGCRKSERWNPFNSSCPTVTCPCCFRSESRFFFVPIESRLYS